MKLVLRISGGIKLWDLCWGLQHWQPKFDYRYDRMLICFPILILWSLRKTNEGEAESIVLLILVFCGYFNCWWVRGDGVGQKVLFRASWRPIFCLFLCLKSWCARGASHHPAFMLLVLKKRIRRGSESKISLCYPTGLRASHQTYREQSGVI